MWHPAPDELDLELIDALQVNPRAAWSQVADALDLSAITAARRWERLSGSGEAWVTAAFGPRLLAGLTFAFVEIGCEPGDTLRTAEELARLPHAITVTPTTGAFDIFAIVFAEDLESMSKLLFERIPAVTGTRRIQSNIGVHWFGGTRWRVDAINASQQNQLLESRPSPVRPHRFDPKDRDLFLALSVDGRRGYTELSEHLGDEPRSIKRRLDRMIGNGDLELRCDLARQLVGWHATIVLWLSVPEERLVDAGNALGALPECRLCAAVVGTHNMVFAGGLHTMGHAQALLEKMQKLVPGLQIHDRRLGVHPVKTYGRILDDEGRCTVTVPPDIWTGE